MSNWFCSGGALLFYILREYQVIGKKHVLCRSICTTLILILNDFNVPQHCHYCDGDDRWLYKYYILTEYIISMLLAIIIKLRILPVTILYTL